MSRRRVTPRKSRRSPQIVRVIPVQQSTTDAPDGRVAPSHMGVTLGFAPPHRAAWYSPGVVRL